MALATADSSNKNNRLSLIIYKTKLNKSVDTQPINIKRNSIRSVSTLTDQSSKAQQDSITVIPAVNSETTPKINRFKTIALTIPANNTTNKEKRNENSKMVINQPTLAVATMPTIYWNTSTQPTKYAVTAVLTSGKRPTIIIYPTVSPESIVIPIVSCILGFPLLALLIICCLRRRAKLARERERRRNYDIEGHAVSLVRFSPIHRLNSRSTRPISFRPERSLSRGFPSLELDTVIEERSDLEQTQTDIISPDSPLDPNKNGCFNSR